jgi:multidrug efflux pump subunit AcrA (membrane-fusion protein)
MEPYSAKAERRDIVGFDSLSAELVTPPSSIAEVHPPYRAPLKRVLVTVGQRVRRGEVLMELDLPDVEAQHEQARLSVQQAEQAYEGAKASLRAPLRDAQRQLEQARATERSLRDRTDPSGDASALVDATNVRRQAEAEVERVNSEYQAALRPYAQQLEEARAAERSARAGAKQASVRAPISGTVVELSVQPGVEVGADRNEVLAKIVDLDDMKLRANVPADTTNEIERGEEIQVSFAEIPDRTFTGYVRGLRTLPENGAGAEADIELRNTQGLVKPDMKPSRVAIETEKAEDVVAVPADAVDRDESGKPIVRVLVNGDWKTRVVETGVSDGKFTEIEKGVSVGETVQVTP